MKSSVLHNRSCHATIVVNVRAKGLISSRQYIVFGSEAVQESRSRKIVGVVVGIQPVNRATNQGTDRTLLWSRQNGFVRFIGVVSEYSA